MNIVISGWPGAGSTTLAILLSYSLKIRLFRGSNTFRLLGQKLNYGDQGTDRINADKILEDHYGRIYDKYNVHVLEKYDNIVMETDYHVASKKNNSKLVSYFLLCDFDARIKRLGIDSRDKDTLVLKERENTLREKYKSLFNIDWFNHEHIKQQYDCLIDNSELAIYEELNIIYLDLLKRGFIDVNQYSNLINQSKSLEDMFWEKGKEYFFILLSNEKLIVEAEEILKDINIKFKKEINRIKNKTIKNLLLQFQ
ncbi:MAG: hypothetical protein NZZ41_03395 [Candidatus Dojkabacteria bacterium]|nr:hypothetical protein [Candidatus Dojkabacteria bacterium]